MTDANIFYGGYTPTEIVVKEAIARGLVDVQLYLLCRSHGGAKGTIVKLKSIIFTLTAGAIAGTSIGALLVVWFIYG